MNYKVSGHSQSLHSILRKRIKNHILVKSNMIYELTQYVGSCLVNECRYIFVFNPFMYFRMRKSCWITGQAIALCKIRCRIIKILLQFYSSELHPTRLFKLTLPSVPSAFQMHPKYGAIFYPDL